MMMFTVVVRTFDEIISFGNIYRKVGCMYFAVGLELDPHSVNSGLIETRFTLNRELIVRRRMNMQKIFIGFANGNNVCNRSQIGFNFIA